MLADANASQKFQNFKKLRKRMLMLSQIVYKSILSRFGLKPFSLVEFVNKGRNWKDQEVVHIWYTEASLGRVPRVPGTREFFWPYTVEPVDFSTFDHVI